MAELKILYPGPITEQFANPEIEWTVRHEEGYFAACMDEQVRLIETEVETRIGGALVSAPRTAPLCLHRWGTDEEVYICHDEESEAIDDIHTGLQSPHADSISLSDLEDVVPELSELSEDIFSTESEKSPDYGFISAVAFLVTGISLVVVSYTVPRDVRVNPDSVSAREMECLVRESAQVGAHLDRCMIAGLCLLTLGGVLLSSLLMISLYNDEMDKRRAFSASKHSAKLYGSINFNKRVMSHLSLNDDDTIIEISS